jgi:transglutaminase-like putative cysteine protease
MVEAKYLEPTPMLDSDHPVVAEFASEAVGDCVHPREKAVRLYYAVRDGILYDPYYPFYLPEHYRASNILEKGRGYCVCKAALLCAVGRAAGIPSRIGFATVRSHLATSNLIEHLGSDLFVYHGFTEFFLEGKWVKSTPAFNKELCHRHNVAPLEFDGREDCLFQEYDMENKRYMEYLTYHGTYADIPLERILDAWYETYGRERVRAWIDAFEKAGGERLSDFDKEEIVKP